VILSSLYRNIGFEWAGEGQVPKSGRELDKRIQKCRDDDISPEGARLDPSTFDKLIHSVLESPKLPNQSSKRFIQATPLIPQVGTFSGSARLTANSWPAGRLVRRMIWLGSNNVDDAEAIWNRLFDAFSVDDHDDVFARFLQDEISAWAPGGKWKRVDSGDKPMLAESDTDGLVYPARRFVQDLDAILATKPALTRRQWTSLLEAIIRLASAAHVAWLCDVHARIWSCINNAVLGNCPNDASETRAKIFPSEFHFLTFGDRALPGIRDRTSAYLGARLGINAALWCMDEIGSPIRSLSNAAEVYAACKKVSERRNELIAARFPEIIQEVFEQENRMLLCKKNIGSNMLEFARHILGQRQAADPLLRGYDQGFILQKSGSSNASPWVVRLGPVAVLALVHCSLAGTRGMRSVHRLSQHLSGYGLRVDYNEIGTNDLGHQLRTLGLVLDSPDAESGMLLVPPFPTREGAAR
tara:strand:+ start:4706 stop:6112 length:1407 start_codon:yes stop_codon:yes gene_type:complete